MENVSITIYGIEDTIVVVVVGLLYLFTKKHTKMIVN